MSIFCNLHTITVLQRNKLSSAAPADSVSANCCKLSSYHHVPHTLFSANYQYIRTLYFCHYDRFCFSRANTRIAITRIATTSRIPQSLGQSETYLCTIPCAVSLHHTFALRLALYRCTAPCTVTRLLCRAGTG